MKATRMLAMSGTLIAATLVFAPATVVADTANADTVVLKTDFSGHPPFKRKPVAAAEKAAPAPALAASGRVDFRGAPPYKRRSADAANLERAEFARFEAAEADAKPRKTRRGPPGKLFSRR